jgi:transposase
MFKRFLEDTKQVLLFATSIDDAIPPDADVRVLSEVMDQLDWSALEASYSSVGCPAYPPDVLAKVLVYAYSKGVRSSRKIEELVENDKRYIWLAGGLNPDHNTIARFRKGKYEYLRGLFSQSVRLCAEAGLVLLNVVSVDSTKIAARASKRSLYDAAQVSREIAAIDRILSEAEEVDAAEDEEHGDGNGRQIPEHLKDPATRRAKLAEIAQRLREEEVNKTSSSEPESRVMKVGGRLRPGYSLQVAVDSAKQVIVGMELTQSCNDAGKLPEMIRELESNTGLSADVVLADRGYSAHFGDSDRLFRNNAAGRFGDSDQVVGAERRWTLLC